MIYCVVPPELESELFDKLVSYYAGNEAVTVVVNRRSGPDRRRAEGAAAHDERRNPGDRRRHGAGGFVSTQVRNP